MDKTATQNQEQTLKQSRTPDQMQKRKGISGSTLKIIAVIIMLIDHVATVILYRMMVARGYQDIMNSADVSVMTEWAAENRVLFYTQFAMKLIGRIALPIFCFLLVEGFRKTRDIRKYMLRIAAFALISEIPFDLAVSGKVLEFGNQNVYFTLFFGLVFMYACEYFQSKKSSGVWMAVSLFVTMLLAQLLQTDYGAVGVLVIALMYIYRSSRMKSLTLSCAVLSVMSISEMTAFLAVIPASLYNGKRGLKLKYFFYVFYPAHLLILYLIAVAMGLGGVAI